MLPFSFFFMRNYASQPFQHFCSPWQQSHFLVSSHFASAGEASGCRASESWRGAVYSLCAEAQGSGAQKLGFGDELAVSSNGNPPKSSKLDHFSIETHSAIVTWGSPLLRNSTNDEIGCSVPYSAFTGRLDSLVRWNCGYTERREDNNSTRTMDSGTLADLMRFSSRKSQVVRLWPSIYIVFSSAATSILYTVHIRRHRLVVQTCLYPKWVLFYYH